MKTIKILLADSDRIFLELGKTFLRKTGVKVLSCMNGEEVIGIVGNECPDLVFMSSGIAVKNGLECLHAMKMNEASRDIPVIVVSTSGRDEEIERFRLAKCDKVIVKPVSQHTFLATVKEFLDLEKRAKSRFETRFCVNFGIESPVSFSGYTVNLSTGGLFLATKENFPINTELGLSFLLPNTNARINCKARVAWRNCSGSPVKPSLPPGVGLQFVNLTEENENAVNKYLRVEHISRLL